MKEDPEANANAQPPVFKTSDGNEKIAKNEQRRSRKSSKRKSNKIVSGNNTKGMVPIPYKPRKKKKLHRKHKRFGKRSHRSNIATPKENEKKF